MPNPISTQHSSSPYSRQIGSQRKAKQTQEPQESAASSRESSSEKASPRTTASSLDRTPGLSAQEKQMIHDEFPDKPDLSMRIYGSDRERQDVSPEAIGQQIDLQA